MHFGWYQMTGPYVLLWMGLNILFHELIKCWSPIKLAFCLISSQKGFMISLIECAHATWFTKPNQECAAVVSFGVGKSLIAESMNIL